MGAELFQGDGWMDEQTDVHDEILAILWTRLQFILTWTNENVCT
jgi:hypothetical protein